MQIDGTSQIKLHGISHDFMKFHDPSARRNIGFIIIRSAGEPGLSPPAIPPAAIIAVPVAVAPVVLAAVPVELALVLLDLPAGIP